MYYRLRSNICLLFCLMCLCICVCVYLYVRVFVVAVLGVGWFLISLLQHPGSGWTVFILYTLCTSDKLKKKKRFRTEILPIFLIHKGKD